MLKCLIIDDEELARKLLKTYADKIDYLEVVGLYENPVEALEVIKNKKIDLVFLDIQMPGMNGFEVVKALQSDVMPVIIFVTAYDQFAMDAFDVHAVDYVLKPLDRERIGRAVERANVRICGSVESDIKSPLIGAIDSISQRLAEGKPATSDGEQQPADGIKRKLLVRDSGVVKVIPFDDIDWVDAAGDYMCVHACGETHIIRITLGELMEKLDGDLFVRIHRSTIVNIERVVSITALPKGGSLLELGEGTTLKVSRNYRESIRNFFQ